MVNLAMIQEDLITFETAVLAKSKGFDLETLHFYTKPNSKMFGIDEHYRNYPIKNISKKLYRVGVHAVLNIENIYYASSHSLLAKWLRDVHNIVIIMDYATHQDDEPIGHITYYCMINKFTPEIFTSSFDEGSEDDGITEYYDTYEQALEQGLQIALKLI